eukprot:scaffold302_cov397-Prasinococcus_capsulatus_cf.AAC.18
MGLMKDLPALRFFHCAQRWLGKKDTRNTRRPGPSVAAPAQVSPCGEPVAPRCARSARASLHMYKPTLSALQGAHALVRRASRPS